MFGNVITGIIVLAVVVLIVVVCAIIYVLARPKPPAPTFGEQLDRELTADLPKPKRPTEYVRDGRPVPVPPTAEELQAIAEAHRRGNSASSNAASAPATSSATPPPAPSTSPVDLAAALVAEAAKRAAPPK